MLIEIELYLSKKNLVFASKAKKVNWVKSLKPNKFLKIGSPILLVLDEIEMDQLFILY